MAHSSTQVKLFCKGLCKPGSTVLNYIQPSRPPEAARSHGPRTRGGRQAPLGGLPRRRWIRTHPAGLFLENVMGEPSLHDWNLERDERAERSSQKRWMTESTY